MPKVTHKSLPISTSSWESQTSKSCPHFVPTINVQHQNFQPLLFPLAKVARKTGSHNDDFMEKLEDILVVDGTCVIALAEAKLSPLHCLLYLNSLREYLRRSMLLSDKFGEIINLDAHMELATT